MSRSVQSSSRTLETSMVQSLEGKEPDSSSIAHAHAEIAIAAEHVATLPNDLDVFTQSELDPDKMIISEDICYCSICPKNGGTVTTFKSGKKETSNGLLHPGVIQPKIKPE